MKTIHTITIAVALALSSASVAAAAQLPVKKPLFEGADVLSVEADCYAVGQDKAAELGGELAKATAETVDGAPVCRVVVIVPGQDGARPQRVAVDIPQQ